MCVYVLLVRVLSLFDIVVSSVSVNVCVCSCVLLLCVMHCWFVLLWLFVWCLLSLFFCVACVVVFDSVFEALVVYVCVNLFVLLLCCALGVCIYGYVTFCMLILCVYSALVDVPVFVYVFVRLLLHVIMCVFRRKGVTWVWLEFDIELCLPWLVKGLCL